ncbi:DNA replication/repair protein RecF [Paenibacillus cymbidii]|uniref:DNA replication/repair protein RecF n=1 Tax=Paenibacillus cymbidii TaxID=1639034 RepID=UPI00108023FE|nr:DNA replication/repair protein RecF [Paenibacillus cymbidii]
MFVHKLHLTNFRNYGQQELTTAGMVNLFLGPNAQGKTNLLESIFVLALTKSHRTHQDKELIGWNGDQAQLYGEVTKKYGECKLQLTISPQGKKARLNGLEQRKLSGFIGALNVVMFAPEDLEIVKGSPGMRRRFLDMEIGQVNPGYLYDVAQYQKVLAQRNNFLKQPSANSASNAPMLEVWNEQLAGFGVKIMRKRQSFIHKLQNWASHIHAGITNGSEQVVIDYDPSFAVDETDEESVIFDRFMVKLSQNKDQELRRGTTLVGPHRDDMRFTINGREVQTYGSQGQQRTTALSLKLAELELIREEVGEYPVLLLDDVLSELDQYRQTQLIETFQDKVQTFITSTGMENVNASRLRNAAIFHVSDGAVRSD